jgi:hypothetical protein
MIHDLLDGVDLATRLDVGEDVVLPVPGLDWERENCRCTVRVQDGSVAIRPCNRHRGLDGAARWDWLSDTLTRALYPGSD